MAKDYVPSTKEQLSRWLKTLKEQVANHSSLLGLGSEELNSVYQLCDEYVEQIQLTDQLRAQVKAEVKKKEDMRKTHLKPLRKLIKKMKAQPTYTKGTGAGLGVLTHKEEIEAKNSLPKLKARVTGELIEVKFKKRGIDGMEFRVKINNGEWINIGRWQFSPMYFKPQGYAQGTALNCMFSGIAIKKDEQFGNWGEMTPVLYVVP